MQRDRQDEDVRDENLSEAEPSPEAGGEAACLAHLVCPDCGVVLDGSPHRPGCGSAETG